MKRIIMLLLLLGLAGNLNATVRRENDGRGGGRFAKPAVTPNVQLRVHDVGKIFLSITNYGFFGSQSGEIPEYTGRYLVAPSCEFPGGSSLEYLFQGALWIGAEVDTVDNLGRPALDTLVSIGNDGWWGTLFEMFPDIPPYGGIKVRSTRPPDVYPNGDTVGAKSEQDYIAVYSDTFTTSSFVPPDPNDGRPHLPLYISITQRSYAWSYEYAEDFVLFDFDIANIGDRNLKNLWVGLYIDADVSHSSEDPYGTHGAQDDICGFDSLYLLIEGNDTTANRINTAWIADNDGEPYEGAYDYRSPLGLSGVRVVRTPLADTSLKSGFNWWISNVDASKDWGPQTNENFARWGIFPGGGMGTPGGDNAKYQVMSNHEFDYDQIWCALTHTGWIAPPATATDLANGYDTRYLFSFGPFPEINHGDTLKLTTAYICGEDLHQDPTNFETNLQGSETDEASITLYYNGLDFQDFATNSQWADWVYDNPGVDTDPDGPNGPELPDGFRGNEGTHFRILPSQDTFWFKGDGVPDFAGPPPPPSPDLTFETEQNRIEVIWSGKRTERGKDTFSGKVDFEGYRIYKSASGRANDFTILGDFDLVDFDFVWWDTLRSPPEWAKWKHVPRKIEEFPADFNPDVYRWIDLPDDYVPPDSLNAHWVPNGWNRGLDAISLSAADTTYSFALDSLSESQGLYMAVTAYDFGNPVTQLSPLESSTSINAKLVYPIGHGGLGKKVLVYPNPYDFTKVGDYLRGGFEDPDRSGNTQFDRRIVFEGLPDGWTIRIFTLDGDLVKQISEGDAYYQRAPGVAFWDLISRNTQAVVSGIYIYVIEGAGGYHELGKIAIIK